MFLDKQTLIRELGGKPSILTVIFQLISERYQWKNEEEKKKIRLAMLKGIFAKIFQTTDEKMIAEIIKKIHVNNAHGNIICCLCSRSRTEKEFETAELEKEYKICNVCYKALLELGIPVLEE